MPSLTIKGISQQLLDELRAQAQANHRSLNGEVLACLEVQVKRRLEKRAAFERIDAINAQLRAEDAVPDTAEMVRTIRRTRDRR